MSIDNSTNSGILALTLVVLLVLSVVAPFVGTASAATPDTRDGDTVPDYGEDDESVESNYCEQFYDGDAEGNLNTQRLTNALIECTDGSITYDNIDPVKQDLNAAYEDADRFDDISRSEYADGEIVGSTDTVKVGAMRIRYLYRADHRTAGVVNDNWEMEVAFVEPDEAGEFSWSDIDEDDRLVNHFGPGNSDHVLSDSEEDVKLRLQRQFLSTLQSAYTSVEDIDEGTDDAPVVGGDNDTVTDGPIDVGPVLDLDSDGTTSGSVVDYDPDTTTSISVFVSRFRDSPRATEPYEHRAMPPIDADDISGDIDSFARMASTEGTATVSANNGHGLAVGTALYGIPDTKTNLTFVVEADSYDDDINVAFKTRSGETLETAPLQQSVVVSDKVKAYANANNVLYVTLVSDDEVTQPITCMAVVTNTRDATTCDAGSPVTESDQNESSDTEDSNDTDTGDSTTNGSNGESATSGSILDYDLGGTTHSESITYASSFYDGDGRTEYLERPIPLTGPESGMNIVQPRGEIENYPRMMDGTTDTAATFSAAGNGLRAGVAAENVPAGQNHVFVAKYAVTDGDAPELAITASNGPPIPIHSHRLATDGEFHYVAADITPLTPYINSNGNVYLTAVSSDKDTEFKVACQSVIANIDNPDAATCAGSLDDTTDTGSDDASVVVPDSDDNTSETIAPQVAADVAETSVTTADGIEFSAASSFDVDGSIEEYTWLFPGEERSGQTVTHSFDNPGTKDVTLRVTDNDGETAETELTVTVEQAEFTKYTWTKAETNTTYKTGATKPGSEFEKLEKIGTNTTESVISETDATTTPQDTASVGKFSSVAWERGEKVGTDVTYDNITKTSTTRPGDGFQQIERVDTTTTTTTEEVSKTIGETGTEYVSTSYDGDYETVHLDNSYDDPVVVAKPLGPRGGQPAHVRVRNVQDDSFDVTIEEWDHDNGHAGNDIYYVVMEAGEYNLGGQKVEAGTTQTDEDWRDVHFSQSFHSDPVVMSSSMTEHGSDTASTRNRYVYEHGFDTRMQENEENGGHDTETIGYIAFERGSGSNNGIEFEVGTTGNSVTDNAERIHFDDSYHRGDRTFVADMQTFNGGDTSNVRYDDFHSGGVDVYIEEEESNDYETGHTTEEVGYAVFERDGDFEVTTTTETTEQVPVYEWKKVQSSQEPVYEWEQVKTTEKPVYKWKKTTTTHTSKVDVTPPSSYDAVVGGEEGVSATTVVCDGSDVAQTASSCQGEEYTG